MNGTQYKMFGFIKKMFITAMTFVGSGALKCVSMSDQECKVRPAIINITSNEPLPYESENIAILNIKGVDCRCVIWGMSRNDAINRLKNSEFDDRGSL